MINYFLRADDDFLAGMGVDPSRLPRADTWKSLLKQDLNRSIQNRQFYYVIWELDHQSMGHSNLNKIIFGQEAYMHLHIWAPKNRQSGLGGYFLTQSIARYFTFFNLQNLFCEPYAMNPGPNKTLAKVGFELVKTYRTTPGWINFEQTVNRWVLSREQWSQISAHSDSA